MKLTRTTFVASAVWLIDFSVPGYVAVTLLETFPGFRVRR